MAIFIDLSKAFDTINHNILLKKLEYYGIRGTSNDLIRSYLSNRKQFVKYKQLCQIINNELKVITEWFKANKLSLNIEKTNYISFQLKNKKQEKSTLEIDGKIINETNSTKFLGIIINKKLNFNEHILYTSNKLAKTIGIITKARQYLSRKTLITLYYTFAYPYLTFGNIIWGSNYKSRLDKLIKLQRRLVRMIIFSPKTAHTEHIFQTLNIIKTSEINVYLTAILCIKPFTAIFQVKLKIYQ